ncbi:MAG: RNB domain-containing ribonuclease, partial [Planctomycetota bacterium]|jgi:ribonuclease R
VAELLASLGVPNLRRIHPSPDEAAAESLTRFLRALGLPALKRMDRRALQDILGKVAGKPESFAVNFAVLRSMQRAEYSPTPDEHFALASEDYAHFTSPIRRYPDLTIHRLLDHYLAGNLTKRRRPADLPTIEEVGELGAHCTNNERRAEAAERELRLVYILRLLEGQLGAEYDGIVTGVTNFGVFVQLRDYFIDGLLRFDDLQDDWWELDADAGCVIGQRSGMTLRIGDRLRVVTARIDIGNRELSLTLAGTPGRSTRQRGVAAPKRAKSRSPRRKTKRRPAARRRKG